MRFHWQNLNERCVGEKTVKGSPLKSGRCWFHFGGMPDPELAARTLKPIPDASRESTIRFEWALGLRFGAHVDLDPDENEITFNLAPIFGSFYLTFQRDRITRWLLKALPYEIRKYEERELRTYEQRETGFYMHSWSLHVFVWADRNSWSRSDPKWKQFSINFPDLVLGRTKHEAIELIPPRDVLIPLPEGQYKARVKLERATWKRARWPWWPLKRVRDSYDFNIPDGIPFPGKGENSWDCGDDGLFGCGHSGGTEADAIGHVVAIVLHNRARYGGGRESMFRLWPETPLDREARLASIRARRASEELSDAPKTSGNP